MNDGTQLSYADDMQRVVDFFQTLTVATAREQLEQVYAPDASFKDPFNEVSGLENILPIFVHMFTQVEQPRFVVTSTVLQGNSAFMTWEFLFYMRRYALDEQCIRGATHFRFAPDGRVNFHRDYWDAAEELYEKLPVLGGLMRLLKRIARK
ncbi:SnoaL-like domain protein [compost metagenome]